MADFDPQEFLDERNAADPQPFYRRVRDVGGAVPGVFGGYQVVRRAEVEYALQHPDEFSSAMEAVDLGQTRPLIPLQMDPPDHVKYRRLLDPVFSPREMAKLEPQVTALVNGLIDGFIDRGQCDFASEFAVPLPSSVFLALMGMPYSDLDMFLEMKDRIVRPGGASQEENRQIHREYAAKIDGYFESILAERKAERRDDLLSHLVDAEVDGEKLTDDEILGICFLMLLAGLDTVTDALECDWVYLARHQDQRRRIVDDPEIIPQAVEELLRYESPVTGVARITAADVELGGCPMPKGTHVGVSIGAANTDERAVPDAETVDLTRNPNRHLAFGAGVHRCLGSHLARLELRVAMREWHRRIPDYRIPEGTELRFSFGLRQVDELPLVFSA
ncbi:MAG TPA: cytochrome P450 [Acidimicrobiales bacterium]|nr:cytochrome P450 [Acidimicrobiales bacterium]